MHKIENKSLWKDEKSYHGGGTCMDSTLEELKIYDLVVIFNFRG